MRSEKGYWFPAKRYGWGWGFPVTWQGWATFIAWFGVAAFATPAFAETEVELRTRVVSPIRLVEVKEPATSPNDYRADADENTLEVVYMSERSDGPSRISPDGQVVYLSRIGWNSKVKEKLIGDALEVRFKRAREESRGK